MRIAWFSSLILLALTIGLSAWIPRPKTPPQKVRVKIPIHLVGHPQVQTLEFIRDHRRDKIYAFGYVNALQLEKLNSSLRKQIKLLGADTPISSQLRKGYHDYEALTGWLKKFAQNHPHLVELHSAGQSVQGRELWYVIVSDRGQEDTPEPKISFIGNMHGDEVVGRELSLKLLSYLIRRYQKDPFVTNLINNSQLFVMPSMNPDGFEAGQRWNANGVDLNRDFPDQLHNNYLLANREPETQAIMELAQKHHFVTGINWHGGELCVNIPWDNIPNHDPEKKFGDDAFIYAAAREYADLNKPMYRNHHDNFVHGVTYGYEWYPIYGGIQDYFNYFAKSIMATVELSKNKWPPARRLPRFWRQNRDSILSFLRRSLQGFHFKVTGSKNAPLKGARLTLETSVRRRIEYDSAFIHKPAVGGRQQVTIEASGYRTLRFESSPGLFRGSYQPIQLTESNRELTQLEVQPHP